MFEIGRTNLLRARSVNMVAFFLAIIAPLVVEIFMIVARNHGVFDYTIDDTYIHLGFARRIQRGLYGINPAESSAPSSSMLWPFLLSVIPSNVPGWTLLPLILNFASSIVAGIVFLRILRPNDNAHALAMLCLGAILSVGLNLTGLVLGGMEHGLQVALTAAGVWGLLELERTGRLPPVAMGALIAAPLVRYESFAVTVAASIHMALYGRRRAAVVVILVPGILAVIFSAILIAHGLGALPTSIQSKALAFRAGFILQRHMVDLSHIGADAWSQAFSDAGQMGPLAILLGNLRANLADKQSWILVMLTLPVGVRALCPRSPSERRLGIACLIVVVLQLIGGHFDNLWFFGYENYAFAAVLLTLIALYREELWLAISAPHGSVTRRYGGSLVFFACAMFLFQRYAHALVTFPAAANYQFTLGTLVDRFIAEHWKRPVGVEGMGIIMWDDNYVLDYGGLSSPEVLREMRAKTIDPTWMDKLARRHDVGLVYTGWTPITPTNWRLVAKLHWTRNIPTEFPETGEFYAVDPDLVPEIREQLQKLARTLPKESWLEICPAPSAGPACARAADAFGGRRW
jgi:hypothetical protein